MSYDNPITAEQRNEIHKKFHDPDVITFTTREVAVLLNLAYGTVRNEISKTGQVLGINVLRSRRTVRIPAYPFRKALGLTLEEPF